MSYQVLARKWRPRNFEELVGQEHVLRALVNALDSKRIHHAFLFTGTRGVGKTTIARILAKSLNCEKGVSSRPCCKCSACIEIDEGRFVDLIEVDAASRTKVEDTRDLLDNVQYAPTSGAYKVYLIDEVHMLSNHSFNALLKTLEEPPPHVKFLLATTDPQKLPVTILSRCLQFNLRCLTIDKIESHLQHILEKESIQHEMAALHQIARAADGSMRDALSLLDQAISFGNGQINDNDITDMLGSIEKNHIYTLLDAVASNNGSSVMKCLNELSELAPDYVNVLSELLSCCHHIALLQQIPDAYEEYMGDEQRIKLLTTTMSAEDVQLYYQIGLIGRRDLALAPEPKIGLEMILLRMLAFRPNSSTIKNKPNTSSVAEADSSVKSNSTSDTNPADSAIDEPMKQAQTEPNNAPAKVDLAITGNNSWESVVLALPLSGVVKQLAMHCALVSQSDGKYELALDPNSATFLTKDRQQRLQQTLIDYTSQAVTLNIEIKSVNIETPAEKAVENAKQRKDEAKKAIEADQNVQAMIETFGATISSESIEPN